MDKTQKYSQGKTISTFGIFVWIWIQYPSSNVNDKQSVPEKVQKMI